MNFDAERWRGHVSLCEVDIPGQRRLISSHVAVIGCGGLASAVLPVLAAAGVGHITLVDGDRVELSNLQRQTIHTPSDLGNLKVDSAAARLRALNPDISITAIAEMLDNANAARCLAGADLVADCTDSLVSKGAVTRAAVEAGLPLVTGAVSRFSGQVLVTLPGSACFACLYGLDAPDPAEEEKSCAAAGIFSGVVALTGAIQASECMKVLMGCGEPLVNRLLTVDTLTMRFNEVKVMPDPDCPVCGRNHSAI